MGELSPQWGDWKSEDLQNYFDKYTGALDAGEYSGRKLSAGESMKWRQYADEIHSELQSRAGDADIEGTPFAVKSLETANEYGIPAGASAVAGILTGGAAPLLEYGVPAVAGMGGDYLASVLNKGEASAGEVATNAIPAEILSAAVEKGLPVVGRAVAAPARRVTNSLVKRAGDVIEPDLSHLVGQGLSDVGLSGKSALTKGQQGSPEWLYYEAQRYDTKNPIASTLDRVGIEGQSLGDRVAKQRAALKLRQSQVREGIGSRLDIGDAAEETIENGWETISSSYGHIFDAVKKSAKDSRGLRSEVRKDLVGEIKDIRSNYRNLKVFQAHGLNVKDRPMNRAFDLVEANIDALTYPIKGPTIPEGALPAAMVNLKENLDMILMDAAPGSADARAIYQLKRKIVDMIDTKFVPDDIGDGAYKKALKAWREGKRAKADLLEILYDKKGNRVVGNDEFIRELWSSRKKTKLRLDALEHLGNQTGDKSLIDRVVSDKLLELSGDTVTTLRSFDKKIGGLNSDVVNKYLNRNGALDRARSWVALRQAINSLPNTAAKALGGQRGGWRAWVMTGVAEPAMIRLIADILPKVSDAATSDALREIIKGGARGYAYGKSRENERSAISPEDQLRQITGAPGMPVPNKKGLRPILGGAL